MILEESWINFFPLPFPRPDQVTAINFALNELFTNNKDCVVMELGLGIGKSAIAVTIANYISSLQFKASDVKTYENGSYILTSQKILQEQYVSDFYGPPTQIKNLVSSTNFNCVGRSGSTCSESMKLYSVYKDKFPKEPREICKNNCPYKKQKIEFLQSLTGITNYAYFMTETINSGKLKPRKLLVVDECHNIESNIISNVEVKISQKFCESIIKIKFIDKIILKDFYSWIKSKYKPGLQKFIVETSNELENLQEGNQDIAVKLSEQLERVTSHLKKIEYFEKNYDENNWIINTEEVGKVDKYFIIKLKPVDISKWTNSILFSYGQKRVLLSATILDKDYYFKSIGLDPNKTSFLSIDSPFDTKNKPIHYIPIGKMSYAKLEENIPKMLSIVKELLAVHKNQKGIIHTSNFRIADSLLTLKNNRLLVQTRDIKREDVINAHKKSKKATVIVSPSMIEGVDLKDDLSRFQIFCKVPFPSMMDEIVKKKMENDKSYYPYVTAQAIVQATGRSVRNDKDWAVTYILDECAGDFFRYNKHLFPKSFLDSVHDINGKKLFK